MSDRSVAPVPAELSPHPAPAVCETRCVCGSLLARVLNQQVELKCRRCKRTTLIPLSNAAEFEVG